MFSGYLKPRNFQGIGQIARGKKVLLRSLILYETKRLSEVRSCKRDARSAVIAGASISRNTWSDMEGLMQFSLKYAFLRLNTFDTTQTRQ